MSIITIPPENVEEQLSPRAYDLYKWLLQVKQKIIFVGREPKNEIYEFSIEKEYLMIETNNNQVIYREVGNTADIEAVAEEAEPKIRKRFQFVLKIVFICPRNDAIADVLMFSDVIFFQKNSEDEGEDDIYKVEQSDSSDGFNFEINPLDNFAHLIELLIFQALLQTNEFKYHLVPIEIQGKKAFVLRLTLYIHQPIHLETITRFLSQFDDMITLTLDFCTKNKFRPRLIKDQPSTKNDGLYQ